MIYSHNKNKYKEYMVHLGEHENARSFHLQGVRKILINVTQWFRTKYEAEGISNLSTTYIGQNIDIYKIKSEKIIWRFSSKEY